MSVAITGIGTISAIGRNVAESLETLKSSKSPIATVSGIDNVRKPYLVGQVRFSDDELKSWLGINSEKIVPRTALLAMVAAKEAWGNQGTAQGIRTGVICATSVGGMELSEQFYHDYKLQNNLEKLNWLSTHDNGAGTDILADYLGIDQYRFTISTACSSAANAILLGARLIENGVLDRVLVGGADALSNFTMNGFDSLMIYDQEWCKPFDANRKGLNLGEAAGFLVLESSKSLEQTGNEVLAHVSGWGNANDAYHQTASSPDGKGATLSITQAMERAGLSPADIDYVNAHGTATPNNDQSESIALMNVFGDKVPPFSSTKAFTGHTLAAAGGIEAVYSVLSIQNNLIFPNLNYRTPMEDIPLRPETELQQKEINNVLSNSFGFGGNTTSLVFTS